MQRDSNEIIFTPEEMSEFKVPERVSIDIAIETAECFLGASEKVMVNCSHLIGETATGVRAELQARYARASRLRTVAGELTLLCLPEITARAVDPLIAEL